MNEIDNTELERLIDQYRTGEISQQDFDALQVILETSEPARQAYLSIVELDAMLYQHFASPGSFPKLTIGTSSFNSMPMANE